MAQEYSTISQSYEEPKKKKVNEIILSENPN